MLKLKFENYSQLSSGARWKNTIRKERDPNLIQQDDMSIVTDSVNWELGDQKHETIRPGVLVDENDVPKWSQGVIFEGPRRMKNGIEDWKPGVIIVPYRWRLTDKDNHIEIGFLNEPNREIPMNIEQTEHGIPLLELPRGYAEIDDLDWISVAHREFQQEFANISDLYPKVLGIINCNTAIIATYIYVVAVQLNDKEDNNYVPRDFESDPLEDVGGPVWMSMDQIQEFFVGNPFSTIKCGLTLSALSLFMLKSFSVQGQPSMSWNANSTKSEFKELLKFFLDSRYDGRVYELAKAMAKCDLEKNPKNKLDKEYIGQRIRQYTNSIEGWLGGRKPYDSGTFQYLADALGIEHLEKLIK